jgi:Protein of unknown function (DUF2752)
MTRCRSHAAFACLTLAAAALLSAFDPAVTWWFPSCPLRELTGWLCPFCGSLRALHALLQGDLSAAWRMNPLTTLGAAAGLIALVHDAVRPARAMQFDRLFSLCFSPHGLVLAVAFGVLRNIPGRSVPWISFTDFVR